MMSKTFSILCPSRGRPDLFARMAESAKYAPDADCEILAFLDDDDETALDYRRDLIDDVVIGQVKSVGVAWNRLAERCSGQYLLMGNDDLVFEPEWDKKLLKVFAQRLPVDGLFVAWAEDGSKRGNGTFPIMTRLWYEVLGYFTPTRFHFLWNDTWVTDIALRAKRGFYIPDVLIEHRHFTFHKAEYDATYRRHREGQGLKTQEDRRVYTDSLADRKADARAILRKIEELKGITR